MNKWGTPNHNPFQTNRFGIDIAGFLNSQPFQKLVLVVSVTALPTHSPVLIGSRLCPTPAQPNIVITAGQKYFFYQHRDQELSTFSQFGQREETYTGHDLQGVAV